jgi:ribosomal protein S27E
MATSPSTFNPSGLKPLSRLSRGSLEALLLLSESLEIFEHPHASEEEREDLLERFWLDIVERLPIGRGMVVLRSAAFRLLSAVNLAWPEIEKLPKSQTLLEVLDAAGYLKMYLSGKNTGPRIDTARAPLWYGDMVHTNDSEKRDWPYLKDQSAVTLAGHQMLAAAKTVLDRMDRTYMGRTLGVDYVVAFANSIEQLKLALEGKYDAQTHPVVVEICAAARELATLASTVLVAGIDNRHAIQTAAKKLDSVLVNYVPGVKADTKPSANPLGATAATATTVSLAAQQMLSAAKAVQVFAFPSGSGSENSIIQDFGRAVEELDRALSGRGDVRTHPVVVDLSGAANRLLRSARVIQAAWGTVATNRVSNAQVEEFGQAMSHLQTKLAEYAPGAQYMPIAQEKFYKGGISSAPYIIESTHGTNDAIHHLRRDVPKTALFESMSAEYVRACIELDRLQDLRADAKSADLQTDAHREIFNQCIAADHKCDTLYEQLVEMHKGTAARTTHGSDRQTSDPQTSTVFRPWVMERFDRADKDIAINADGIGIQIDHDDVDHAKSEAVARLIVAAPEMLAALKDVKCQNCRGRGIVFGPDGTNECVICHGTGQPAVIAAVIKRAENG